MSPDRFRRDLLPSWQAYADRESIRLIGQGRERRAACGIHGGSRDSLTINEDGPWHCHACGAAGADVLAYHRQRCGLTFKDAARDLGAWVEDGSDTGPRTTPRPAPSKPVEPTPIDTADAEAKRRRAAMIWQAAQPLADGTPAVEYLRGRCCVLPPADGDLRWMPGLRLFGFGGPALVGRMSLAGNARQARGVHLTWLIPDGTGGWRRSERRYLGPKAGCVVRLWPDDAVTYALGVAEGIETALALAHADLPVWASLDAGNLAAFPVLGGIEALTVAADHDPAGIAAAERCADRWAGAGCDVRVVMPQAAGADLNDTARAA